jgi:arginyl-tRNA synthetase
MSSLPIFYAIILDMKRHIQKLISEVLGNMFANGQIKAMPDFRLDVPKENFGDYTTSIALSIAREGKYQPNDVAEIIAKELQTLDKEQVFKEIKVVNGFINISVTQNKLAENALAMQKEIEIERVGEKPDGGTKKVVFEYSSPNTNKPLHIGHSRNDFFGMACINMLRATGHDVVACEIINDRGIHIMKSMLMYMQFGNAETPEKAGMKSDHFVGKFYAMFEGENQKQKNGEEITALEKEAQELLQKWEAGDAEVRALWKKMNEWFFAGVKQTYQREGSVFDDVEYESDIYDKGRDLVLKGVEQGVFQKEEDGSVVVDLTDQGLG